MKYIKSPLNYIGGKYRLLPQITPLFPKRIRTFVDVFAGGVNVGINAAAQNYRFNDINHRLINMMQYLSHAKDVEEKADQRITQLGLSKENPEAYLMLRREYNRNSTPLDLYLLICFGYNHQIRFNAKMEFNNPFGKNRSSFSENMRKNLKGFQEFALSHTIQWTSLQFDDEKLYQGLNEQDFVYLDPPYLITTGTYNDGKRGFDGWGIRQEMRLYDLLLQLDGRRIPFALSNVLVHKGQSHELLKGFIGEHPRFNVSYLQHSYQNSSHNTRRGESVEILLRNFK